MSHQRVLTLYPYLLDGTCWVFDDERTGLKEEAFVLGMTEMISRAVDGKGVHDAAKGFALSFSDEPFDGHDVELHDAVLVLREAHVVLPAQARLDQASDVAALVAYTIQRLVAGRGDVCQK